MEQLWSVEVTRTVRQLNTNILKYASFHGHKLFLDVATQNELYLLPLISFDLSPFNVQVNYSKTSTRSDDSPRPPKHFKNEFLIWFHNVKAHICSQLLDSESIEMMGCKFCFAVWKCTFEGLQFLSQYYVNIWRQHNIVGYLKLLVTKK